jgi:hypothetical protein
MASSALICCLNILNPRLQFLASNEVHSVDRGRYQRLGRFNQHERGQQQPFSSGYWDEHPGPVRYRLRQHAWRGFTLPDTLERSRARSGCHQERLLPTSAVGRQPERAILRSM